MSKDKSIASGWRSVRVYIISSLLIIASVMGMLALKKFWPFGDMSLLTGDFIHQGWVFISTLRQKLMSGDSLLYTWNGGYGVNFFTTILGYLNPIAFVFLAFPDDMVLQVATVTFIISLVMGNCSMLYFLTHRPKNALAPDHCGNMLFSLSYVLCIYVVSNIVNWHFLAVAVYFPLILLGLERYVYEGRWRLYAIMLAISILTSYYIAILFCFFIFFYYMTLDFKSFKAFLVTSFKVLGLSLLSIATTAIATVPVTLYLRKLNYTISFFGGDAWFQNYFNIIQSFFAFHEPLGMGKSSTSYGDVNLYYGLLPLLLTSMYFFQKEISLQKRLRCFAVFAFYMIAFDNNTLNYFLHVFHYPSWFPNRFSWFFTIYCIVLASETWNNIRNNKKYRALPAIVCGVAWLILIYVCYYATDQKIYTFVYSYSAILIGVYLLLLLIRGFSYKIAPSLLIILGCLELILSFSYSLVYHHSGAELSFLSEKRQDVSDLFETNELKEASGFSRMLTESSGLGTHNTGFLMGYKSPTIFSGTMNNIPITLIEVGVECSGNVMENYVYTPVVLSLLNNQYILSDFQIVSNLSGDWISSGKMNPYDEYPVKAEDGYLVIFENEDVLSLGYMIDNPVDLPLDSDNIPNQNVWIEQISGVSDVFEEVDLEPVSIEPENCQAVLMGKRLLIAHDLSKDSIIGLETVDSDDLCKVDPVVYNPEEESTVLITYHATEPGRYYVKLGYEVCYLGNLKSGEEGHVVTHVQKDDFSGNIYGMDFTYYVLNEDKWKQAHDYLAAHQLQVEEYSSDYVIGTIETDRDGLMFTSIPYDGNWHAYVDDVETEVVPLNQNSFCAIHVPKGTHKIRFQYRQDHLLLGGGISLGALLGFIILEAINRRKRRKTERTAEPLEISE